MIRDQEFEMINKLRLISIVFAIFASACSLISDKGGEEIVFSATEVGTPVGDKVSKEIGPAGGTLISPDGRITLTVPPNAVSGATSFSMQPISNTAVNGMGLGYRLEPSGKTFNVPLQITVRYDEKDMEGTFAEALTLAYQDEKGAWHSPTASRVDSTEKTLSVSTTHFTDWTLVSVMRLTPARATVRVGESVTLTYTNCYENLFYVLKFFYETCRPGWDQADEWSLVGDGRKSGAYPLMIYNAPSKKPSPNVVKVVVSRDGFPVKTPCGPPSPPDCILINREKRSVEALITIVDRGYRVSGQDGPVTYSGVVCDLERPFSITGTHPLFEMTYNFVPSGPAAGTASYSVRWGSMSATQSGPYTVEGADTDTPQIVWRVSGTARIPQVTTSGGGDAHIILTPLAANEGWCGN